MPDCAPARICRSAGLAAENSRCGARADRFPGGPRGLNFSMRYIARFLGFAFTTFAIIFVVAAAATGLTVWKFEQDLPDYTQLQNYEPPVETRVHAADGSVLAEYSKQRRLYLPSSAIPPLLKEAFISAEDKNFYHHGGVDFEGMRARRFGLRAGQSSMFRAPRPSPSRSPRTSSCRASARFRARSERRCSRSGSRRPIPKRKSSNSI